MMSDQITAGFCEPNQPLAGRRLLLVEDEALLAMELEDLISSLGGEAVGPFGRVADALEALSRERVDGAVLDVRLDGDTTFQIADVLLQAAKPILFVTGAASAIPEGYRQVPRLHKPFDETQFAGLAKSIFAGR
jgi:DNA-binding LytR/AlgR family response regulator